MEEELEEEEEELDEEEEDEQEDETDFFLRDLPVVLRFFLGGI